MRGKERVGRERWVEERERGREKEWDVRGREWDRGERVGCERGEVMGRVGCERESGVEEGEWGGRERENGV